jgi:diacylglycerol kinase (ATP)
MATHETSPVELLLVANPTSGRGRAGRWVEAARARLVSEGFAPLVSTRRGEAGELLDAASARFAEHWLFGGDGTLGDLVQHLRRDAPPRVVLFPAGTGNVVARDVGVPLSFEGAWEVARSGSWRRFDLARVNGRRFAFMVSAGLDAQLAHWVAARRHGPMRRVDWLRAAFAHGKSKETAMHVVADGRDLGHAAFVALFNCGLYAGGFRVCPAARFDDGLLHLLLLREPIKPRWVRVAWAALRHRPESLPDATLLAVRRAEIRGVVASQVDGDPGPGGDLVVEVEPGAVLVRGRA